MTNTHRRRSARKPIRLAGLVALLLAGGCQPNVADLPTPPSAEGTQVGSGTPSATPVPSAEAGGGGAGIGSTRMAVDALADLPVKGRAPRTGYDRDLFGQRWADIDRNGCDQRNDILNRDLTDTVHREGTHGCVVVSGVLNDPYTGARIDFVRGNATSSAVQIDHVVALSDAWQKGAQQLSDEQRRQLANDPLNLLAVDGPTNQSKSDGDAATWLPPVKAFRCEYVATQVAVKLRYGLWVTQAERDAIERVLARCPEQRLPGGR